MSGWDSDSWDPEPWTDNGRRDSWATAYGPLGRDADRAAGSPPAAGVGPGPVLLAAGGGAVVATGLGLLVLLLGGVLVGLIIGGLVLLGAAAMVTAYLRGAR